MAKNSKAVNDAEERAARVDEMFERAKRHAGRRLEQAPNPRRRKTAKSRKRAPSKTKK